MRDDFGNRFRERMEKRRERWEHRGTNSNIWTGAFILLIGVAALIKVSNPDLPHWIFSWKTFLIGLGLFIGFKHGFKGGAWFILILIGSAFLYTDIYPELSIRPYVWPGILIAIGAMLMLRPRRSNNCKWPDEKKRQQLIRD